MNTSLPCPSVTVKCAVQTAQQFMSSLHPFPWTASGVGKALSECVMIIYKATNANNGKVYIGQTIQPLNERIGDHRRKALVHSSRSHFHSAIRKYGFGVFEWKIVEEVATRGELNEREKYWIVKHESTNPQKGYNNTHGGDAFEFTEETKKKIGRGGKGIKRSEAFKANLRRIMSGSGNYFYGRKHTEEAKQKNREAHSSIDEKTVRQIKIMIRIGVKQCDIMRRLGVARSVVYDIKKGNTWSHVEI